MKVWNDVVWVTRVANSKLVRWRQSGATLGNFGGYVYRRPNLLHEEFVIVSSVYNVLLFLLLLSRRSDGSVATKTTVDVLLFFLCRLENLERTQETLVDAHHRTRIVEFTTIVGSAEKRDELPL